MCDEKQYRITFKGDKEEVEMLLKAGDYYCALDEIREFLRRESKYEEHTDEASAMLEKIRSKFLDIIDSYDIRI